MKHDNVRILLAEDNATNQLVALKMLEKMGYRADAVADGTEAISSLRTIAYDLVLMDCQMPEMDGYEATRAIRNGKSRTLNPQVPIIALTANAMKGDSDRCLEAGMNDYLSKPVLPKKLAEMLDRWLTKKEADTSQNRLQDTTVMTTENAKEPKMPIFDKEGFVERLMGDEDSAKMILELFLEDVPQRIEEMKSCLGASDAKSARTCRP